jgi:RNA polymerase-binding transcription factor DksA
VADEDIEKQLREQHAELQQRLASLKTDASKEYSGDSAEQAQERENDEVVDAIGQETALALREVTQALDRIADGSYGVCEACGGEIAVGRLRVLPQATRCVNCAA